MKIAIVGAGVVGVTTAYELALDGHAVTVFEQRSATAEEASFATGGLLAPGVLGQTGIEAAEILASAARLTRASAVIAIDALAIFPESPYRVALTKLVEFCINRNH